MDKHTKTIKFLGGPLDGQTKHVDSNLTIYKHEQPPLSDDIIPGEVPVGFFPPMHEYIYHEESQGSSNFIFREQRHQ